VAILLIFYFCGRDDYHCVVLSMVAILASEARGGPHPIRIRSQGHQLLGSWSLFPCFLWVWMILIRSLLDNASKLAI
jgi:hypothetical protein